MRVNKFLRRLWSTLFGHDESALDGELDFHIQMRAQELERSGLNRDQALREARLRFGNLTLQRERTREATTMVWLESIFQDLRYALRMMRKTTLVTGVAVLSLALGIGANTAIFTVLDAILLRSLPVKDPDQVVVLSWADPKSSSQLHPSLRASFSFPAFEEFRRRASTLSDVFALVDLENVSVAAEGRAEIANGQLVSGNYYSALGISPVIGRPITIDDDRESAQPVCTISYRYWRSRFALDPAVLGRKLTINSVPFTLIGVEPDGFLGMTVGIAPDVTIPIRHLPKLETNWGTKGISLFLDEDFWAVQLAGRLKPAVTRASAQAELTALFQRHPPPLPLNASPVVTLGPPGDGLRFTRDRFRNPLLVLASVVALVLLIACANVANLLLARAKAREKETAMRLALGAARGRIARQLLTESILLASFGAALGIGLAYWSSSVLAAFNDLVIDIRPDLRVLGFTAAITLLTGILFGLAPALRTARVDLQPSLQRDERSSRLGLTRLLVIGQLALSLVVLVGAGLYLRTLHNLRAVDLGMNPRNLLVFRLLPALAGYSGERAVDFDHRVVAALEHLPGVQSAASSRHIPLSGSRRTTVVSVPGLAPPSDPRLRTVFENPASAHFLETMGIPLLLGRGIQAQDRSGSPLSAVINETLARVYFPNESPIGRHFKSGTRDFEVVGVARDSKYNEIRGSAPPTFFSSDLQSPTDGGNMAFELRTIGGAAAMAGAVRRAVAEIDSNVPVFELSTEEEEIDGLISQDRLFAGLSATFGVLALLLSAIGLYGVGAYAVARRTPEIGIRMALGADRGTITQMILRETGWLALVGVAIGLGVAYAVTRYIQSMLYGLAPHDLTTFAGATLVLVVVAALAGYLPARRASKVDPMVALWHE
jgi:predicted permease